jgi:hypothetical protein
VRFGQCPAQPIPRLRQQDQVNMIVHQAPAQAGNGRRFTGLGEQLKIERPIASEKNSGRRRLPRWVTWCGTPGRTTRASLAIGRGWHRLAALSN